MADMFELRMMLPSDIRCVAMVRDVAAQCARYRGCSDAEAAAFGRSAETAVGDLLAEAGTDATVCVVLQRSEGRMAVVMTTEGITRTLQI
jgi:hypothetical protein